MSPERIASQPCDQHDCLFPKGRVISMIVPKRPCDQYDCSQKAVRSV